MDWDITHSFLFTGAGSLWGAEDTRPGWFTESGFNFNPQFSSAYRELVLPVVEVSTVIGATTLGGLTLGGQAYAYVSQNNLAEQGIDLNPYHSQHFVNVQLPVAKIVAVAAITYYTGGLGSGAAAYLGAGTGMATAVGVAAGAAAGAAAGTGYESLEDKLDLPEGEGWLAENAAAIGVIIGGAWFAYDRAGKPEPTLEDVQRLGAELDKVDDRLPVRTVSPRPRQITVPGLPLSPAADNTLKALALGAAFFALSKF